MELAYQVHGYKSGHQCLSSSVQLERDDQDAIDRLSDISGPIKPNEIFEPYLTCYPLPSNSYFVLARTWQDLNAPRAGCVITKSLLIPMDKWLGDFRSDEFFTLLLNATPDKNTGFSHTINAPGDAVKFNVPVKTPLNELVEAIFIEKRKPIVYFNASDPDLVICKLYAVLWQTLKRNFAVCSFALSQRSIEGRPFDLLFTPASAKGKFSEWKGRRIDAINDAPPRHRWTPALVESIFRWHTPYLIQNRNDLPYDPKAPNFSESDFRIDLAWVELLANAKSHNPYLSILGLLDIINTLKFDTSELRQTTYPIIRDAIHTASERLPPAEVWMFFTSVLLRYHRKMMDRHMFDSVKLLSQQLAERDPNSSLDFLMKYERPITTIPAVLFAGIGDGLAKYYLLNNAAIPFDELLSEPLIPMRLVASSEDFSKLLITSVNNGDQSWDAILDGLLLESDERLTLIALKNLSLQLTQNSRTLTVEKLLNRSSSEGFGIIVKSLLKNSNYDSGLFTDVIYRNAVRLDKLEYLWQLLEKNDKNGKSDRLLSMLILTNYSFLDEIVDHAGFSDNRLVLLSNQLFAKYSPDIQKLLQPRSSFVNDLLSSPFAKNLTEQALINILVCSSLPTEKVIGEIAKLPDQTFNKIPQQELEKIAKRWLSSPALVLNSSNLRILRKVQNFDHKALLLKSTAGGLSRNSILQNLNLIFTINQKLNRFLYENVNYISQKLGQILDDESITNEIAARWIKLLAESAKYKKPFKEAAFAMLEFAYKCNKFDATNLVAATFPIIYRSFAKGKTINVLITTIHFPDWDKCKALREDLIKLYLNRNWSKAGLLYIANASDILKDVIKLLDDKKKGRNFLDQALVEFKNQYQKSPVISEIIKHIS